MERQTYRQAESEREGKSKKAKRQEIGKEKKGDRETGK